MKTQYVSTEILRLTFPPFFNVSLGAYAIDGLGVTQVVVRKPDNTTETFGATFDTDVKFWVASVPLVSFQEGLWLAKATSDVVGTSDQYQALTWGDYVDDIPEARQAAMGRWQRVGDQLIIYEDDGTTPFRTFDLIGPSGPPSTNVIERDPV